MSRFTLSFAAPLTPDAIEFLEAETGIKFGYADMREWFCITAWNDTGSVVGVLACEPKTWFDWHFSCAIADQRVMTRRLLKTIFKVLFTKARRVTALVDPTNGRALKQVKRMGFVHEGYCRLILDGSRDAMVFGMVQEECLWLPSHNFMKAWERNPLIQGGRRNGFALKASGLGASNVDRA